MFLIRGQRFGHRALLVHGKAICQKHRIQRQALVTEGKGQENRGGGP